MFQPPRAGEGHQPRGSPSRRMGSSPERMNTTVVLIVGTMRIATSKIGSPLPPGKRSPAPSRMSKPISTGEVTRPWK